MRFCARRLFTLPFLCWTMHRPSLHFLCCAVLRKPKPSPYFSTLCCAFAARTIARQLIAVAFPGASRRLVPMPSHRVSLFLNTSPSLCETSPSSSVAVPCHTLLFLCCSSGSKTELSLPYAVLDCAALHLSVATPCATSPFLCCAPPGTAYPRRCFARRAY